MIIVPPDADEITDEEVTSEEVIGICSRLPGSLEVHVKK